MEPSALAAIGFKDLDKKGFHARLTAYASLYRTMASKVALGPGGQQERGKSALRTADALEQLIVRGRELEELDPTAFYKNEDLVAYLKQNNLKVPPDKYLATLRTVGDRAIFAANQFISATND